MKWTPETSQEFQRAFTQDHPEFVKSFPAADLKQLVIDADVVGHLALCCDAVEEAQVMGTGYQANPDLLPQRIEKVGTSLFIKAANMHAAARHWQKSKIELLVRVPAAVQMQVRFVAGAVYLKGGTGELNIHGGAGLVQGVSHTQHANIRLGVGEIQLAYLHAQAYLRIGCGAIDLLYDQLTGGERIEARCGLGAVDLRVPPDEIGYVSDRAGLCISQYFESKRGSIVHAQLGLGSFDIRRSGAQSAPVYV